MDNGISGEVEGMKALQSKLASVTDDIKLKGGRFALRKAGNVLQEAAVNEMARLDNANTPESIAKNVKLRFSPKKFNATGDLMFRLGILGGAASKKANEKNPGGDTFYWRFLEFGTEKISAKRPLTNAVKSKESQIMQTFKREYEKALDRAIRRAKK